MKSRKALAMVWALVILIFTLANVSYANLINGDFSSGWNSWQSEGDVQSTNEDAILGDNGEIWSALYQPVALDSSKYTLEFDFSNKLSSDLDESEYYFTFYDTFFASLYFINDVSRFNLDVDPDFNVFDDSLTLFDMDATGVFNNNGIIGSSSKGQDWLHFSSSFNNTYAYVIPTFELLELNFIDGDSQVLIDNVSINPVPEPATLLLFGTGLVALAGLAPKKTKNFVARRILP